MTLAKLNKIERNIAEQFGTISRSITDERKPQMFKKITCTVHASKFLFCQGTDFFGIKVKLASLSLSSLHFVEGFIFLSLMTAED